MTNFADALVRAAGVASVGGSVGASIGGSVAVLAGPAAVGVVASSGLAGSVFGFVGSLCSDLLD